MILLKTVALANNTAEIMNRPEEKLQRPAINKIAVVMSLLRFVMLISLLKYIVELANVRFSLAAILRCTEQNNNTPTFKLIVSNFETEYQNLYVRRKHQPGRKHNRCL